jgi:hypothetical protein
MKHANKSIILIASLAVHGLIFASQPEANFEFWNKHNDPVYFAVGSSAEEINQKKEFKQLRPGTWTQATLDVSKPTVIALKFKEAPTAGDRLDTFTIKPNKKIIARVGLPAEKEKFKEQLKSLFGKTSIAADGYIFGPQTGPLLGFRAASGIFPFASSDTLNERGLHLKGNFTKDDVTKGSMIYLPE